MRSYLVIYEKSKQGYSAYVPDLPGCTSAGATREETKNKITEAIKLYLEVLQEDGVKIPDDISESEVVTID